MISANLDSKGLANFPSHSNTMLCVLQDGNSLWELLLIKAEIVQDYRLTGAAPILL